MIDFSGGLTAEELKSSRILILDSAIHSGKSMYKLIKHLQGMGAEDSISYGLVLKAGSVLVPTYFGMVIDDKDRAYFQLEELPNNRLGHPPPQGLLREIAEADVDREMTSTGAPFVGLTPGDLFYDRQTKGAKVYLFETGGEIAGFISFRKQGGALFIDAWGTGESFQGRGIGGATMRWAETWARSQKCDRIELWAYAGAVDKYLKYAYEFIDDTERNLGEGQTYRIMSKKILYNVKVTTAHDTEHY